MAAREIELQRLIVRLIGDMSSYQKMLSNASRITGQGFRKMGEAAGRMGRELSTKVTAPLVAMGAASVKAFADFDKAMTESTSIMRDATDAQKNLMRQRALDLAASGELKQSATQLAESYFFLASAGKNAEQSMKLLPQVAKFATAGNFDMALATDLLTDAQSALGLASKDAAKDLENMTRVADVLVKANTIANASVKQFSESLTNEAGAALKVFNKDIEEGVAVLAAYADQGIKGQVAGTSLARVMRLLSKSALDNADAHAELGFRVFDAEGNMRNFADIMANLEQVTHGMSDEMRSATLAQLGFEARVQGAILPLLGLSDTIRQYEADLRSAAGITEAVADDQMKSFSAQLAVLKNQLTVVAIELGQILIPHLLKLTELLRDGIKWFKGLSKEQQENIVKYAAIAAAIGPALMAFSALVKAVGLLTTAFKLLATPQGIIVAGLALLAKTTWDYYQAQKSLNDELEKSAVLNDALMALQDKRALKTIDQAEKIAQEQGGKAGRKFLDAEVSRMLKEEVGLSNQIKGLENELGRLNPQGARNGAHANLADPAGRALMQEIEEARARLKAIQRRRTLIEEGRNGILDLPIPIDPNANKNAQNHEKGVKLLGDIVRGMAGNGFGNLILNVQPGV